MEFLSQKKWLGLNTREASEDILPVEWELLKNFNPFIVPGKLTPDRGYALKFAGMTALEECYLLASMKNQINGDEITLANSQSSIWLWKNGTKDSSAIATNIDRMNERNVLVNKNVFRVSAIEHPQGGKLVTTPLSNYEPLWIGFIKRSTFGGLGPDLEGYYSYTKYLSQPTSLSSASGLYGIKIGFTGNGSGTFSEPYYKFSFIYDDFQESTLSKYIQASGVTTVSSITINIEVPQSFNKRITAINVYRALDSTSDYYYLETVYISTNLTTWSYNVGPPVTFDADITDDGSTLIEIAENRMGFEYTDYTCAFYYHQIIHNDVMYLADVQPYGNIVVSAGTSYQTRIKIRERNKYLFSKKFEYDVTPETQYGYLPDSITAIGKTNNYVIMWTKNAMYFIEEDKILDKRDWLGCWAPNSVSYVDNNIFFANRESLYLWDGLKAIDILSDKLKNVWDKLWDEEIAAVTGTYYANKKEYVLSIPGNRSFTYNLETGQWRERSFDTMSLIITNANGELIATDSRYIYTLDSGYNLNGSTLLCQARTKKFSLDKKMYFELMRLFLLYRCSTGTFSVKIYKDDSVIRTLTIANQTTESMIHLALTGYTSGNAMFLRNMQLEFLISAPVVHDAINEVGLEYNLVDLL